MDIQVVLAENDPKLGRRGQVIKVSPGYAYNFLIPQKKAKLATQANLKVFQNERIKESKEDALRLAQAQQLAEKISGSSLTLEVLAGTSTPDKPDEEKLYGAVTAQEVVSALARQGIVVEKKDIQIEEPIKKLGAYEVPVKLHPDVKVKLKLWVVKKKS